MTTPRGWLSKEFTLKIYYCSDLINGQRIIVILIKFPLETPMFEKLPPRAVIHVINHSTCKESMGPPKNWVNFFKYVEPISPTLYSTCFFHSGLLYLYF